MNILFNDNLCSYFNNRIEDIAKAAKFIGTGDMVNAYDRLSYGQNRRGELVVNYKNRDRKIGHTITIVFRDSHMEMYNANGYGCILETDMRSCIDYDIFKDMDEEFIQKYVSKKISAMMGIDMHDEVYYRDIEHDANPVINDDWRDCLNHNIEQIRDACDFIGTENMKYGQAFYGFNDMGHLCILLKHHRSFKKYVDIAENDWGNAVLVEFSGDGVIHIFKAGQDGKPVDSKHNRHGLMDSHGTGGKSHQLFVENVKKNFGVYLI